MSTLSMSMSTLPRSTAATTTSTRAQRHGVDDDAGAGGYHSTARLSEKISRHGGFEPGSTKPDSTGREMSSGSDGDLAEVDGDCPRWQRRRAHARRDTETATRETATSLTSTWPMSTGDRCRLCRCRLGRCRRRSMLTRDDARRRGVSPSGCTPAVARRSSGSAPRGRVHAPGRKQQGGRGRVRRSGRSR